MIRTKIKAINKTDNWPNSTPTLNASSKEIKLSFGNPYWVSKVANPRPWRSPKLKTTIGRAVR